MTEKPTTNIKDLPYAVELSNDDSTIVIQENTHTAQSTLKDISDFVLNKLTAGDNITIENGVISTTSDVNKDYVDEQNALQDIELNAVKSDVDDHEERIEALENRHIEESVSDVQINGTSIVVDKVANIPHASDGVYGVTTVSGEKVDAIENRVDVLEKMSKGILYDFVTQTVEGTQSIPKGSHLADVQKLEGHSEVIDGELQSVDLSKLTVKGKNLFNSSEDALTSFKGSPLTYNDDGTMTLVSSSNWGADYYVYKNIKVEGTYIFSVLFDMVSKRSETTTSRSGVKLFLKCYDEAGVEITTRSAAFTTTYDISEYNTYYKAFVCGAVSIGQYNNIVNSVEVSFTTAVKSVLLGFAVSDSLNGSETTIKQLQFERGATATPYSPYSETEIPLAFAGKSAGTVRDELDLVNKKYIQRVGVRAYQSGDENNTSVITDMNNTYYELAEPIITDVSTVIDSFEVEGNGSIDFDSSIPVRNTIEYLRYLNEV